LLDIEVDVLIERKADVAGDFEPVSTMSELAQGDGHAMVFEMQVLRCGAILMKHDDPVRTFAFPLVHCIWMLVALLQV